MINDENTILDPQDAMPDEAGQHLNTRLSRAGFFKAATATALGAAGVLMYTAQPTLAAPMTKQVEAASQEKKTQSGLYYIKSVLTGLVLDVPKSNRRAGTLVSVFPQTSPFSYNQLWFVSEDGYIQSLLNGFVLDARGGNTNGGDVVDLYPRRLPPSPSQHWFFSAGYIYTAQDGTVLDISGGNTNPGALIIVYPKNVPRTSNQQWTLVPAF